MSSYLEGLNPQQREAAEHFEGPLLVLAGAGSGKTRVLTARIAHLIDEFGVDPSSILALTFTNKAAGEMRDRLRRLLGRDPAGMWVGTFHAIGARMLRRDAGRLGWTPGFLIYDADDSESLVRRIIKDQLRLDPKRWHPRAVRGAISAAKNELVGVQLFADQATDAYTAQIAEIYEIYQRALRDANAFDFDDLLVKPVELLRAHPGVLRRYRERFSFLLVDEYQDTNRAQYVFLRLLASPAGEGGDLERPAAAAAAAGGGVGGNLFVVGDDDQSIYGWRGADIRNILDFEKDFADARVVRLEQNYRSTQRILDAANRVISANLQRKGKTLHTANGAGEMLTLVESADEADEAQWITREIVSRMGANAEVGARGFVVLYRTNAQSRALEEALRREGLPYRIIGGTRFYERREVKDVLAYLRLIANPAADEAFLRIVNVPRRGIGDTSVSRLAEWATRQRLSLLAAAARADEVPDLRGVAVRALPALAEQVARFAVLAERDLPLDETIRELVRDSGLVQMYRDEGADGEERLANIDELIAGAAELQARYDAADPDLLAELEDTGDERPRMLDLFLAHVALVADIDQHDANADAVSLMTIHNAKGLEFPYVFVAGLEEGLFPLARAYDEPAQLEEERRLFYVAITRAETKLYLTLARRRRRGAEWMDSGPSTFLESVPQELLEVRRSAAIRDRWAASRLWRGETEPFARRSTRLGLEPAARVDPTYQVDYSDSQLEVRLVKGARVRHPQFGAGTVAELSGAGSDVRATIDFDGLGRKKVIVRYANLQPDD
jgi:DNA helicase II / ATP-dependent DNA helicase PcrA